MLKVRLVPPKKKKKKESRAYIYINILAKQIKNCIFWVKIGSIMKNEIICLTHLVTQSILFYVPLTVIYCILNFD